MTKSISDVKDELTNIYTYIRYNIKQREDEKSEIADKCIQTLKRIVRMTNVLEKDLRRLVSTEESFVDKT
jgi:hypothetical protein